jgi:hypothetical protein
LDNSPEGISPFAVALRDQRRRRSLTIRDITQAVLLSDKQIIGLENDDHTYFYSPAYAGRAARAYAEFLEVDVSLAGGPPYAQADELNFKTALIENPAKQASASRLRHLPFAIIGTTISILLAYTFHHAPSVDTETSVRALAPRIEPLTRETITSSDIGQESLSAGLTPPLPSVPLINNDDKAKRFFIVIKRPTVVTARDSSGKLLMSGEYAPTGGKRISGQPPFSIILSDPEAAEIYYQGSRIRPTSQPREGITVSTQML